MAKLTYMDKKEIIRLYDMNVMDIVELRLYSM